MNSSRAPRGGLSAELADFTVGMHSLDIPDGVRNAAKRCIIDGLGVAVAALFESPTDSFLKQDPSGMEGRTAEGPATQLGAHDRVDIWDAAIVNGTLIHGLDFDDGFPEGAIHPGAAILPTVLALAEKLDTPDDGVIRGLIVGYEVCMRLAESGIAGLFPNGFHPTSLCGTVGAAAATAYMLGLGREVTRDAIALSTSFASGLTQGMSDGSSVKKTHGGWGAQAGMRAAWYATKGFTGPIAALEGVHGLMPTHAREGFRPDVVTTHLGSDWFIERVSFKPYPCCHLLHAPIDAVQEIRSRERFDLERIRRIVLGCPQLSMDVVVQPDAEKRRPSTSYGAKFSLPFGVAVAFVDQRVTLGSFAPDRLVDQSVISLIDRIECYLDEESSYPPVLDSRVRVEFDDGSHIDHRQVGSRGTPTKPLATGELVRKFVDNCRYAGIDDAAAAQVADQVLNGTRVIDAVRSLNREVLLRD